MHFQVYSVFCLVVVELGRLTVAEKEDLSKVILRLMAERDVKLLDEYIGNQGEQNFDNLNVSAANTKRCLPWFVVVDQGGVGKKPKGAFGSFCRKTIARTLRGDKPSEDTFYQIL
jgi:hypothetical protein